jgi:hypothetical protein
MTMVAKTPRPQGGHAARKLVRTQTATLKSNSEASQRRDEKAEASGGNLHRK